MSLREQRGWPVVVLSPAQHASLTQGLSHGPQSSISVRTLTLMLSLPPWMWACCSPGLMITLDKFLTHVCICVLPWELHPRGEGTEAGLGRGAIGSQRGPSRVILQREEVWYLPPADHWELASPSLWSWAVIWDEKAPFIGGIPHRVPGLKAVWWGTWVEHCNTGISLVILGTERIGCDASAGRSLCLRAGWFREVRWPAERWGQRLFSSSRWRYWGWHAGNRGVGEEEWQNTRFTSLWTPFCSGLERCFCHLPVIYLPLLRVASLVSAADEIKAAPSPLTCRASFPCPRPKDPHSVTPPVCLLSSHFSFLPGKFVKCVQSRGCGLKPPEQNSTRLAYCRSAVF